MNIEIVKKLRSEIPIPLSEAKHLLSTNNNNVEKCVILYKDKIAKNIMSATGCTLNDAQRALEKNKFDVNRALSSVIEEEYDKKFVPTAGVDKDSLLYAKDWLYLLENRDLSATLSYKHYDKLLNLFSLMKPLAHLTTTLKLAKEDYDRIFEGYTDQAPMDDFIRRNTLLDVSLNYQNATNTVKLEIEKIKDELRRQWRNVNK